MFYWGILALVGLHILVWLNTSYQFIEFDEESLWSTIHPFWITVVVAFPTAICGYFSHKWCYEGLGESAWALKFLTSATSYIVFPLMTWYLLGESMFQPKILVSIFLSAIIIWIQVYW